MKHLRIHLFFYVFVIGTSLAFSQSDENQKYLNVQSNTAFWGISEDSLGTPPADVVEATQEPQIIFKKEPLPVLDANGSVIEGIVFLKLWVGTDGLVRKAVLLRADYGQLVQPSLIAAMQYRFEPAKNNGIPVDVWVTVPFKYRKK